MLTKPDELKILEEGTKRAEDRLKAPTPNIWMSITTREPESPRAREDKNRIRREGRGICSGRTEWTVREAYQWQKELRVQGGTSVRQDC